MKTLNFLPPKLRDERQRLAQRRSFIRSFIFILVLLAISTGILVGGQIALSSQRDSLQNDIAKDQQQTGNAEESAPLEERITRLNANLKKIAQLQDAHIRWVPFLQSISLLRVPGIQLQSLSPDSTTMELTITGVAQTRDQLLLFIENLDSSPFLGTVEYPITLLTQTENINFSFIVGIESLDSEMQ